MSAMTKPRFKRALAGMSAAALLALPGCIPQALAADPTDGMIATASALTQEYDLPDGLILAVCETESDFDPSCVTGKCKGIMQIHSSYASGFAKAAGMDNYDLLDYADSMRIGAYLLSDYMTRYEGDIHFTLMAYNLGEYGALARRRDGVESTGYSWKVISRMGKWADATAETEKTQESDALKTVETVRSALSRWLEVLFK